MDRIPATAYGPVSGWSGNWMYSGAGMALEPATNLLLDSPGVLRTEFLASTLSGRAPTSLAGWSGTQSNPSQYRRVYLSQWVMAGVGAGYQNNPVGTKFGFFGYGQPAHLARNQSFLLLKGTGITSVMTGMELRFEQQGVVDRSLAPNRNTAEAQLGTGLWHQVEVLLEVNSAPGLPDGQLHIWLDGVLIHQWTDMVYLTLNNTNLFQWYDWNPTWGGSSGVRTQADNIWMDHLYISGAP